jgi:hypothetical protein
MTKEEAMKLENRCDKIMSGYLGRECIVSMALTGKLKICFDDGAYIAWNMTCDDVDYVCFVGFYDDLVETIGKIKECITDNRDIFDKLIWSYEYRRELEE